MAWPTLGLTMNCLNLATSLVLGAMPNSNPSRGHTRSPDARSGLIDAQLLAMRQTRLTAQTTCVQPVAGGSARHSARIKPAHHAYRSTLESNGTDRSGLAGICHHAANSRMRPVRAWWDLYSSDPKARTCCPWGSKSKKWSRCTSLTRHPASKPNTTP